MNFQDKVQKWLLKCFGLIIAMDKVERNHRFLEESLELVQSCGCSSSEAHQLVDYVFNRPVGEPYQEVGGVMVTLAALCEANGLDMDLEGRIELSRISDPKTMEKVRVKQSLKPKHSPLPEKLQGPDGEDGPWAEGWEERCGDKVDVKVVKKASALGWTENLINNYKAPDSIEASSRCFLKLGECQYQEGFVNPYVTMPFELTAENGAKGLLSGEFFEEVTVNCPECISMDVQDDESCPDCGGTNQITVKVPVSWTTIKAIYKMAVKEIDYG